MREFHWRKKKFFEAFPDIQGFVEKGYCKITIPSYYPLLR